MNLEQTIKDTVIAESQDLDGRLQQLVRAGLMPSNTIPVLRKAIAKVQGGMTLQGAERDVMANFINSMMFIVLGDDSIFNKARAGAKTYATEAKEKTEYDYEGDMAMGQLKSIIANSQRMHDMLSDDTNLPEWVQSKITLAEDYISTASNYMQGEMNEEVESIDELSKKTLGSYVKKAIPDAEHKEYWGRADRPTKGQRQDLKSAKNRRQGINKAIDKLTKEETQIDELSKATLGSYIKKASGAEKPKNVMDPKNVPLTKIAAYQGDSETGHFGKRFNQKTYDKAERLHKNRSQGITRAADKLAKEEVEQVDEISKAMAGRYINKAKNSIDLTAWRQGYKEAGAGSPSKHMEKKLSKRHKGIETAVKKLTKEESEQIDELSKKTLGSYVNKAAERIGTKGVSAGLRIAADEKSSGNFKDMGKRQKGISRAVNKLTKEDIDAVKQMNESYKTAFETALNEYGIKSPSELDESKRKEFFNHVDLEFKRGDN